MNDIPPSDAIATILSEVIREQELSATWLDIEEASKLRQVVSRKFSTFPEISDD